MAGSQRLVLHIGLEKTATTSFQRFCFDNAAALEARGLLYPRGTMRRGANHKRLAASYLAQQSKDRALVLTAPDRQATVQTIREEAKASGAPAILLSAEHFSSRFREAEIAQLAKDFEGFDPIVVMTIRDPYARFLSSYYTYVLGGGRARMPDYERRLLASSDHYLSVTDTLAPWEAVFGRDHIRLLDYDAEANILEASLGACGIDGWSIEPGRYRELTSLRADVVLALRAVNQAIEERQTVKPDSSDAAWTHGIIIGNHIRRALMRGIPEGKAATLPVSPDGLAALDAIAARDCAYLEAAYALSPRGSATRSRITPTTDGPAPAEAEAEMLLARALVRTLPPGFWTLSAGLVRIPGILRWLVL